MAQEGMKRSYKQLEYRLKHLKKKYRMFKDKMAKSGAGSQTPPKFFNKIYAILGTRPQTRPNVTLDSGLDNTVKNVDDTNENHVDDVLETTPLELSCKHNLA